MRYALLLTLSLLLSGCSLFQVTPKAPPAPTGHALRARIRPVPFIIRF